MVQGPFPNPFQPQAQTANAPNNPFLEFLEGDPEALFRSFLPQNFTRNQERFSGPLFERIADRFRAAVGRDVRGGGTGELQFNDFLKNNFNFQREFLRGPQSQTGAQPQFIRPTRFLFQ